MADDKKTEEKPKSEKRPVSPINGQPIPRGRPKGVPNKATTQFKEALNVLFESSAPEMCEWLADIKEPEKRFDILAKFAEYIYPKLSRAEQQQLDKDGNPADATNKIEVVFVKADTDTGSV